MAKRTVLPTNVFDTALERMIELYKSGDRIVVGFSAGKDSGICLELARIAARATGNLPVEAVIVDDEIMVPGTYEYAERVHAMPDVKLDWLGMREPMVNVFNRKNPFYWVFDEQMDPKDWVRQPPDYIEWYTNNIDLYHAIWPDRYPPKPGHRMVLIIGLRTAESANRVLAIHSAGGFISAPTPTPWGPISKAYPIYDWKDGDVWKAVQDNGWDYNHAYDTFTKMGVARKKQRVAPPTMAFFGMELLRVSALAWPKWFDKVSDRCPGIRSVVNFGVKAIQPMRLKGESWRDCYYRECVDNAPEWIAKRSQKAAEHMIKAHQTHSTSPFPETSNCFQCAATGPGSWRTLGDLMYTGDPYSLKARFLPYIQPGDFRPEDTRLWEDFPASDK